MAILHQGQMNTIYDEIGKNYSLLRRPDERIARRIRQAIGEATTVLNVGAGSGSYEPTDCEVTAVEPSEVMIRQRPPFSAPAVQCSAEALPFEDRSFDASMAILTVQHWSDRARGLAEMRRVTRNKMVIVTYDPDFSDFWLLDYFPELKAADRGKMPTMQEMKEWLGPCRISPLPVPEDCEDGFVAAYWKRPEAYLDKQVRAAMSPFRLSPNISAGLRKLSGDIKNGTWHKRYETICQLKELDCGYRLIEIEV